MADKISVIAELERIGWKYRWAGAEEVAVLCPFHEDTKPSCSINVETALFKCQTAGCEKHGDFLTFLGAALGQSRAVIYAELGTRYKLEDERTIDPKVIERWHQALWRAKPLVKQLHDRAVSDELIRQYRLGESGGRITIPIKNASGLFVNVRKYLPGAPGADKMRNQRTRGKVRLFPIEQMQYDKIVLCGGEIKAIAAAAVLNAHGIGAVSATGGESNWDPQLTPSFVGKKVWVLYDIDAEGQKSARARCNLISRAARWIGNVVLPLDIDEFPHGDVNDYLAKGLDLPSLLQNVEEWVPDFIKRGDDAEEPTDCNLVMASSARMTGKRLRVRAVVSAMDTAPFIIPSKVLVRCDKSQKECALCPIYYSKEDPVEHCMSAESQAVLAMVGSKTADQRDAIMQGIGIPRRCKVVEFDPLDHYACEDVRVSPSLEITNRAADRTMQPAIVVKQESTLELNETYNLVGRMHPHPKNQQSTLVISQYETAQDALSSYEPTDLERLDAFRPDAWTAEAIRQKLDDIYADLEANVTHIFQRRELHLMLDLAWHSPLFIAFDGQRDIKGWVEVLILGDSAQGKSEATKGLMGHYGVGEKTECKNASVAGLLGGLQQMAGKWFVTWGTIPTHDKRLMVLEELKGASTEVISRLTDMRSSGIAEIPKIEKRRTHARTRLIALSNPRSDQPLSSYNYGIEAIPELIGGLEDVRRFDACLLLSSADIDRRVLNKLQVERPTVKHEYTSELCRALILWAWTRDDDEVTFDPDAERECLERATILGEAFTDIIPIVDSGSMKYKIARLAASLAARTFSTSDDRLSIRVRKAHVEVVAEFLHEVYSSPTFGYAEFTKTIRATQSLKGPEEIRRQIEACPLPLEFIDHLLHTAEIEVQDIADWNGWERQAASMLMSVFVRKNALQRVGRSYRKTSAFISLLKELQRDDRLRDRPDFIPETMQGEF